MRSQVVQTLGSPGTFDITDKDNPLYYIARYCHECSMNLYELNADGFQFEQLTVSEVQAWHNTMATYVGSVATWLTSAIAASEAGTAIPAKPYQTASFFMGDSTAVQNQLIKVCIDLCLEWIRAKLDGNTDATEIAQVLKRAFLGEDGEGDEYALIEQMANTPLEIVVSKADGFEDISYADRPET